MSRMPRTAAALTTAALALTVTATVTACGSSADEPSPAPGASDAAVVDIVASDYSQPSSWLAWESDPQAAHDVFLVYPSQYMADEGEPMLGALDDAGMRAGAEAFLADDGAAFTQDANVYAPLYRQLDPTQALALDPDERDALLAGAPNTDVLAAFDHYVRTAGDRPLVLVGHSQGSQMLLSIVEDHLAEHPEVVERLVAVYAIGYAVTEDFLAANPHVPFATGADDTGVLVSYNTEAEQVDGDNPTWLPGAVAINPVSWTRGGEVAPASENLGSWVDGQVVTPGVAPAQVDVERGVVVAAGLDRERFSLPAEARATFPLGVYHGYDIGFYAENLRANVAERVAAHAARCGCAPAAA